MEFWPVLFDVGVLLGVAFVLGALCERLKQSALLGYLLAGMLLGPNSFDLISTREEVRGLAEIGVSMLLFSLGLEFSWRRLRRLGITALGGGVLQVGISLFALGAIGYGFGLPLPTAIVVGAALALSSTAGVLRILTARTELDSPHGRLALGILLFQDLAVVPLVLLASVLSGSDAGWSAAWQELGWTVLLLAGMVAAFWVIFNSVVPRVLLVTSTLRNRELPVLLAVVGVLGAIYVAHALGLSPAVGAFIAGMLLGESPFATQVRSDLSVLRTLLVAVFFSSVGMLADPHWIATHVGLTLSVTALVVVLKTLSCYCALRLVKVKAHSGLAAGIALSQVGEFAFLIAEMAHGTLIDENLYMVIVSTMMVTLMLTPYLVAAAPLMADLALRPLTRLRVPAPSQAPMQPDHGEPTSHIVLIGYGPAGEKCGALLRQSPTPITVLDLNPTLVARARDDGFTAVMGDATHPEVLDHLGLHSAVAAVITLPDPRLAESVLQAIRCQVSEVPVIVRSRYHKYADALLPTGPGAVVDEEQEVGDLLGQRTLQMLEPEADPQEIETAHP